MKFKNGIYNIFYSILGYLITIILGLTIPRLFIVSFGSELNGLLNSINQLLIYIGLLEAGIGITTVQALYYPVSKNDKGSINRILSATNYYYKRAGVLYLLFTIAIAFIYPLVITVSENYFTVVGIIIFSGLGSVINFFFQGKYKLLLQAEGKNYIITNIHTILHTITSISKIICIYLGFNVLTIQFLFFIISLFQLLFIYNYVKKHYNWLDLNVSPNYKALSQKNSVLVHQISGLIFQNTDILLLTLISGLKVVSVYSMYKLIIGMVSSMLSNIGNSILFALGQTYSTDKQKYVKFIDIYDTYYSAIGFALFTITYILILPFMKLYTSGITDVNYIDKWLPILFIVIEILVIGRNAMINTINVAGHFKKTEKQSIVESLINIIVSIIGGSLYGIYGVLIGTIVALFYRTNDIIMYANSKILNRNSIKSYRTWLSNFGLMVFIIFIVNKFNLLLNSYINIIIVEIVLCVIVIPIFIIFASIINYKEFKDLRNFVISKILTRRKIQNVQK